MADSRSTKGLFFISALCLICFVSSTINVDQLERFKETCEELQEHAVILKDIYKSEMASTQILSDYMSLMDPMITLLKKTHNPLLSDEYSAVDKHVDNIRVYMLITKAKIDRQNEKIRETIEADEAKVMFYQNAIRFLEKQQAELAFNSSEEVDE